MNLAPKPNGVPKLLLDVLELFVLLKRSGPDTGF